MQPNQREAGRPLDVRPHVLRLEDDGAVGFRHRCEPRFSDSSLVNYKTDELIQVFEKIKEMKRHSGYPVVNPTE